MKILINRYLPLVLFAAGSASAAEPIPVEEFVKPSNLLDMKISPDGRYTASTVPQGDGKTILIVMDYDKKTVAGFMQMRGDEHIAEFNWVSNDRLIVTPAKREGALATPVLTGELYGVGADGSGARVLFGYRQEGGPSTGSNIRRPEAERASATLLHALPKERNHVLVKVEPWGSEAQLPEVRRLNVKSGATARIVRAPIPIADFIVDQDGAVRLSVGTTSNHNQLIHRRSASGGEWTLIHDESEAGYKLKVLAFEADGRHVLVARGQSRGADALYRWDIDANTQIKLEDPGVANPHTVLYGIKYKDPYAVVSHPDRPSIHYLDPKRRESRLTAALANAFPGQFAYPTSFTENGKLALVRVSSDRNPGEFYLFDLDTMRATYIDAVREWIDPERMATSKPIVVKARDGVNLRGYLVLPAEREAKLLPMVVVPHGGPHQVRDYWLFDEESQLLASRGYAVLRLNFRGSDGYGSAFERAGYRQWGGLMQDDLADVVRWTVAEGIADGDRICIYGASYGGYAALMNPIRYPDLYKCAAGYVGVYDLPLMFQDGNVRRSHFGREYLGIVLGGSNLAEISPVNHADKLKIPVFLIHGGQDTQVPPAHADRMRSALQKVGNDPQWLMERAEGHGFYTLRARTAFYTQLLTFLDQNIGVAQTP